MDINLSLLLWSWTNWYCYKCRDIRYHDFYRASIYASAVLVLVILFVCPFVCLSVCHTRALWQNQTMHCGRFDTARKGNHSSLLTPTVVGGRRHFSLKFAVKVTHPFETRRLRQISAYNVSTVRDSENNLIMTNRKSTTFFPLSYRWNADVTHKSSQGWLKKRILCFFE